MPALLSIFVLYCRCILLVVWHGRREGRRDPFLEDFYFGSFNWFLNFNFEFSSALALTSASF